MGARFDLTPRLSIVLPALRGLDTVEGPLAVWDALEPREQLELVVLCPDAAAAVPGRRFVDSAGLLLHEARAKGIHASTTEFVFIAEDHCVPDELWVSAVLSRLDEGWDGIGCALRPGNDKTARGQAAFLLGYGEWLPPVVGGPARVLSGHNVVLRRQLLVELGDELAELLVVSAFLVRQLGRSHRFTLEPSATMRHFDAVDVTSQARIFAVVGMSFGAMRTRNWPSVTRPLYSLLCPVIAAAHWRRALIQFRRAGRANGLRPICLLPAAVFAAIWAAGEAIGAVRGVRRVARNASFSELKPVKSADL
jgi:hypothetical protein